MNKHETKVGRVFGLNGTFAERDLLKIRRQSKSFSKISLNNQNNDLDQKIVSLEEKKFNLFQENSFNPPKKSKEDEENVCRFLKFENIDELFNEPKSLIESKVKERNETPFFGCSKEEIKNVPLTAEIKQNEKPIDIPKKGISLL